MSDPFAKLLFRMSSQLPQRLLDAAKGDGYPVQPTARGFVFNADLVSVILESRGFSDLLERVNFMQRVGHQDAQIVGDTRSARAEVLRQAKALAALERRDRILTDEVLAQRNQVAAIHAALLNRQIEQLGTRAADAG